MIYDFELEAIESSHPRDGCLSLNCAGKFIAFIELLFYIFIFFSLKDFITSECSPHIKLLQVIL
jgi:hypothetical protein